MNNSVVFALVTFLIIVVVFCLNTMFFGLLAWGFVNLLISPIVGIAPINYFYEALVLGGMSAVMVYMFSAMWLISKR